MDVVVLLSVVAAIVVFTGIIGVGDVVVDAVAMRNADVFMLYCA